MESNALCVFNQTTACGLEPAAWLHCTTRHGGILASFSALLLHHVKTPEIKPGKGVLRTKGGVDRAKRKLVRKGGVPWAREG